MKRLCDELYWRAKAAHEQSFATLCENLNRIMQNVGSLERYGADFGHILPAPPAQPMNDQPPPMPPPAHEDRELPSHSSVFADHGQPLPDDDEDQAFEQRLREMRGAFPRGGP